MKKLLILTVLIISTVIGLNAQSSAKENNDQESVYWFYLKPAFEIDENIKKEVFVIKKVYAKVYSGTFNEFSMIYKKELANTKIAIGPFSNKQEAEKAKAYYSLVSKNKVGSQKPDVLTDDGSICYFYLCDPIIDVNTKELKFERMPASIASSSQKEFVEALSDIRLQGLLVVGPFSDYFNAEKSKFVNRNHNANIEVKNKFPSISSVSLTEMAKKWESINVNIQKDSIQVKPDVHTCSVQLDFPARYFDSQTLQAYVIKVEYDDLSQIDVKAKSFNGDEFKDNNKRISFENGYSWKQNISFPKFANRRPQKVIISSVLFTNSKMLKCEDLVLEIE